MNGDNKTDFQKYVEGREKEKLVNKQQNLQDYINGDEKYKQEYWNSYFVRGLLPLWSIEYPVNISEFREHIKNKELNIERFLPGIIKAMEEFSGEEGIKVENIFILDEQAKKYLETHGSLSSHSKQVKNIVNGSNVKKNKTSNIEGADLSSEELAERVGDLFYDSLAGFVSLLGHEIKEGDKELSQIGEHLKKASLHIYNAWTICLPYIGEGFPNLKHSHDIKGIEISREELTERIANLTDDLLKKFLIDLSKKIYKDGLADQGRGREKLATELFEGAKYVELAGNSL